jgi:hypothetical protein
MTNKAWSRVMLACVMAAGFALFGVGCAGDFYGDASLAAGTGGAAATHAGAGGSGPSLAGGGGGVAGTPAAAASAPIPTAGAKACSSDSDCDFASCTGGTCRPQTCFDGIVNQDETDVDCGGVLGCPRCATAQHCASTDDCDEAACLKGICQAPSCSDGMQNGSETGSDCGGSCPSCTDGQGCLQPKDCQSQVCLGGAHVCALPSCVDGIKNGAEPSVDCGGACTLKCQLADACTGPLDCASGACFDQHCVPKSPTGKSITSSDWVASASNTYSSEVAPRLALDGDPNTFWTGGEQVPGMWFQVDMIKPQVFYAIEVRCLSVPDFGKRLRLSASLDGNTFVELRTNIVGESALKIAFFKPQYARYLKLELLESAGGGWWRIDDLVVRQ